MKLGLCVPMYSMYSRMRLLNTHQSQYAHGSWRLAAQKRYLLVLESHQYYMCLSCTERTSISIPESSDASCCWICPCVGIGIFHQPLCIIETLANINVLCSIVTDFFSITCVLIRLKKMTIAMPFDLHYFAWHCSSNLGRPFHLPSRR